MRNFRLLRHNLRLWFLSVGLLTTATASANSWATAYDSKPYGFFVQSGAMCVSYRDASGWKTEKWPASGLTGTVSAEGYINHAHAKRLEVFASTTDGRLKAWLYDSQWHSSDWGKPTTATATTTVKSSPAASVSQSGLFSATMNVYVAGADGHLWRAYRPDYAPHSQSPKWEDLGKPNGVNIFQMPTATSHNDQAYVFVVGDNGRVFQYVSPHNFLELGAPTGTTIASDSVSAVYDPDDDAPHIFVRATNGHLYRRGIWTWLDQGSEVISSAPATLSLPSQHASDTWQTFVFGSSIAIAPSSPYARVRYQSGATWQWASQGQPNFGTISSSRPGAAGYFDEDAEEQHLFAFYKLTNNKIAVNVWDGDGWSWADAGSCPLF